MAGRIDGIRCAAAALAVVLIVAAVACSATSTSSQTVSISTDEPAAASDSSAVSTEPASTQVSAASSETKGDDTSTATMETVEPPTAVPAETVELTSSPPLGTVEMATTVAPAPVDDSMSAIDVLAFIPVTREVQEGYNRDLFGDWQDADGNGCDTRHEVLISESLTPVQIGPGCSISNGAWTSAYDGVQVADASALDIDHVVALKEAWDSGAWAWDDTTRAAFANDLSDSRSLIAVTAGSNRSKGDRDPSNWLPSDPNAVCAFIGAWIAVKARWQLAMDESEWGRIKNQLNGACAGLHLAPWPPATVTAGSPVTTTPTPASATTAYQPPTPPVTSPQADVYYKNCAAAKAAGVAPLHVGEPGYRDGLDRDHDGVACEN